MTNLEMLSYKEQSPQRIVHEALLISRRPIYMSSAAHAPRDKCFFGIYGTARSGCELLSAVAPVFVRSGPALGAQ